MKARKWLSIIGITSLALAVIVLAYSMAGNFGAVLGLCLAVVILIKFLAYLGLFTLPGIASKMINWVIAIVIISILAIWIAGLWEKEKAVGKAKQEKLQAQAEVEFQKKLQKFYLPACDAKGECEEVPTVDAGPGTKHRIRADAPYRAVSIQPDGKRIEYNMPAGWESWTGAAPAGKVRLMNAKGVQTETPVEILRVQ